MNYNDIINKGLELGFEEIEIYAKSSDGNTVKLMDKTLTACHKKTIFGVSIRALYEGKMVYTYTESLEDNDVLFLLNEMINNAKLLTSTEQEYIYDGKGEYQDTKEDKCDYNNYSLNDKKELLLSIEKEALEKDNRIKKVGYCQYMESSSTTEIINSKGLNLKRSGGYCGAFVGALASNGEQTTMGYEQDIEINFKKINVDKLVNKAVSDAVNGLGASSATSGKYPVVLRKDVATDILQAFCSIFSGEAAIKKLSILKDKIGEKVFGENINIFDDPFCPNALIKTPFDDEGVPCKTKALVENGVLKGLLHSQKTAHFFNAELTGNGFKPNITSSVNVLPTNLYIKSGSQSFDEIIASTEKGILVTEVNGLHAGLNPISGNFNVQASGFTIEKGKIDKPITLFVVSGNFYEMMNQVEIIGNDQEVFTDVFAPTLKIKELNISGK